MWTKSGFGPFTQFRTLHGAFMRTDHKSAENTVKLSVFFALLGSAQVKAAHKMLVKLTTGDNKIQLTKKARQFH